MRRRQFVQAGTTLAILGFVCHSGAGTKMNTLIVGPWSFDLPADWKRRETQGTAPYMEAEDGTKGCYIWAITFPQPRASSEEAAAYLQDGHERVFMRDPTSKWKVVERSPAVVELPSRSVLDLFDESNSYRILSVVIATTRVAIQL